MEIKVTITEDKDFTPHMMYDPNSDDKEMANKKEDHERLADKGYIHIDPKEIRKIIGKGEGGAAGLDPFLEKFGKEKKKEIEDALEAMDDIGRHEDGDYIMSDDKEILVKEGRIRLFLEKKKKKKKKSSGKKDACYHKVKSRYKVWPSAYASGALVKCRKVGAKNWGNKSKQNEEIEIELDDEIKSIIEEELEKLLDEESLFNWFKSGGWRQAGGKYDGKPCAKQPGQKTKPKCVSRKKYKNTPKKDREAAARRKRKKDPNPNRRGKPIYVNTDPKKKKKTKSGRKTK